MPPPQLVKPHNRQCLNCPPSTLPQAFSAFYHAYKFLQRATGIKVATPSQMDMAVRTLCGMSLSEVTLPGLPKCLLR